MAEKTDNGSLSARQKRSPRFADLARAAGVSEATVDRVLNERGSVSAASREKVLQAARALNLPRRLPGGWHGTLNLQIILPRNPTPFWSRLNEAVKKAAVFLPKQVVVHRTFVAEHDEDAILDAIRVPTMKRSGLVIAAEPNRRVLCALEEVAAQGVAIATLVTETGDLPYFGVDNYKAGRTLGYLMAHALRKDTAQRILVLQANDRLGAHRLRFSGFQDAIRLRLPNAEIVHTVTEERVTHVSENLSRWLAASRIDGLYDTGYVTPAIEPVIRKLPVRPIWAGHEADSLHKLMMKAGLMDFVIDQNPSGQASSALQYLCQRCGLVEGFADIQQPSFSVFTPENLS